MAGLADARRRVPDSHTRDAQPNATIARRQRRYTRCCRQWCIGARSGEPGAGVPTVVRGVAPNHAIDTRHDHIGPDDVVAQQRIRATFAGHSHLDAARVHHHANTAADDDAHHDTSYDTTRDTTDDAT